MTPTRMFDYGVPPDDIARMQAMTAEGMARDIAAESLADAQEHRARHALGDGRPVTAVEAYRAAAANLIFAQMAFNDDTPRKRQLYDRMSSVLSAVSGVLGDRFEKLELGFGSHYLVGWLVRPPEGDALGTVVVFGGQSGWGAAYWRHADALAARGLATILAEGPGQGETRLRHHVYLDGTSRPLTADTSTSCTRTSRWDLRESSATASAASTPRSPPQPTAGCGPEVVWEAPARGVSYGRRPTGEWRWEDFPLLSEPWPRRS